MMKWIANMLKTNVETHIEKEFKSLMFEYHTLIRLINKIFEEDISKIAKSVDLTYPQFLALLFINHNEGLLIS